MPNVVDVEIGVLALKACESLAAAAPAVSLRIRCLDGPSADPLPRLGGAPRGGA